MHSIFSRVLGLLLETRLQNSIIKCSAAPGKPQGVNLTQPRTRRASMLQCFCWSQRCWWQGLSQALVWASLGSGSCLQVLSQALLSSSFDFRGKGCTIMAASIWFTKIRLWSKFSPWCTIAKGGFSCSGSAHADEQTNYTHLPSPGCCWSQRRCRVCRVIWLLDPTQLARIATTLRRTRPCDTAGLQIPLCRAWHTCLTGGTRVHSCPACHWLH